jgi:HK97 family phage prohead protease
MKGLSYRATFETRATGDGTGLTGYAATFNKVDSYGTAFAPGAFIKTLQERRDQTPILLNHNPDLNVGIPETLETDSIGLKVDAQIFDDDADGTTLSKGLRAGARYGLSFGFKTLRDHAANEDDQLDMAQALDATFWDGIRVIEEVKLYEVSVVTFPANDAAQITAVRQTAAADALRQVLDDITNDRLSDDERPRQSDRRRGHRHGRAHLDGRL